MGHKRRGDVAPFHAMDVLAQATKLSEAGHDVLALTVGQPAALVPQSVRDAAAYYAQKHVLSYTDALGRISARRAISEHYKDHYGLDIDPDRIVVTTGSSAGFSLAFLALAEAGGRIAITSPGYPAYRNIIQALSMECVELPTDGACGHMIDLAELVRLHKQKPIDALLLASPANPTGAALDNDDFARVIGTCRAHGIAFLSDEIYHRLRYDADDMCALEVDEGAFVINSFSKYYCMTGWRIGWMVVPTDYVRTIERLGQNLYISAPDLSQLVVPHVFAASVELDAIREGYLVNREILRDRLPSLGFEFASPLDGAFYAWCDVSGLTKDSMAFAKKMLSDIHVACAPGLDFDTQNGHRYMRLSYAGSKATIEQAMDRIEMWLK